MQTVSRVNTRREHPMVMRRRNNVERWNHGTRTALIAEVHASKALLLSLRARKHAAILLYSTALDISMDAKSSAALYVAIACCEGSPERTGQWLVVNVMHKGATIAL